MRPKLKMFFANILCILWRNVNLSKAGALSVTVTTLLLTVWYATFIPENPIPIEQGDSVSLIVGSKKDKTLLEVRNYRTRTHDSFLLHREIYEKADPSNVIVLEGGSIGKLGGFAVLRAVVLPPHIKGRWCSKVIPHWWPFLSLKEHSIETEDICFEVPNE